MPRHRDQDAREWADRSRMSRRSFLARSATPRGPSTFALGGPAWPEYTGRAASTAECLALAFFLWLVSVGSDEE